MPIEGFGNVTNDPLFVNHTAGNLRLQSNSPCLNAGLKTYVSTSTDLDGNPRIVKGSVDLGAYEFQGSGSVISYAWLQWFGLPNDGSADFLDTDGDGLNNWQEWRCQTDPTNPLSVLRLMTPAWTNDTQIILTWPSVAGVNYFLERSTDLAATPAFHLLITNLPGPSGARSYTDTNTIGAGPCFYRLGVGK